MFKSSHQLKWMLCLLFVATGGRADDAWQDVFTAGEAGYRAFRIPAMVRTLRPGELLAFAEGRRRGSDFARQHIVMKRSSDDGQSWSALRVVAMDGHNHLMTPCPLLRSNGEIFLFYIRDPATLNMNALKAGRLRPGYQEGMINRVFLIRSRDHGVRWSKPGELTSVARPEDAERVLCVGGLGLELQRGKHSGRLIMPFHAQRGFSRFRGPDGTEDWGQLEFSSYVIFSDDGGQTWQRGNAAPEAAKRPIASAEPQIVELDNDRVLMNCRNQQQGRPWRKSAISHDGGVTWTKLKDERKLIEPRCQAFLVRASWGDEAQPGQILFSNPANSNGRSRGLLRISSDGGKTWPQTVPLYAGRFAHSVMAMINADTVGVLAELDGYQRIAFRRLKIPSR